MKQVKAITRYFLGCLACMLLFMVAACGTKEENDKKLTADTSEIAGTYYLDLSELGMKLMLYLRLDAEGGFQFSGSQEFAVDKGSGSFEKSGDAYIMVYSSVNGQPKSVSDGITSSFRVTEDGKLDFSICESVYYGSVAVDTISEEDSNIKLMGVSVTEGFAAMETETAFETGMYTTADVIVDGVTYHHTVSFFEDATYLHFVYYEADGKLQFMCENGNYGVSTTQLALGAGMQDSERVACEVVDGSNLKLSVFETPDSTERTLLDFVKQEEAPVIAVFAGQGTVTGSTEEFEVTLTLKADGSYVSEADGFSEKGFLVIDSAESFVKQYPNHPETDKTGLSQVATVPYGSCSYEENEKLTLAELRIRNTEGLSRQKATVTQNES